MTFFRDLFADLVDRRLWPVALALVAALVAVPLALSKGQPNNDAALAQARAAADRAARIQSDSEPVVRLASDVSVQRRHLRGLPAKDPFAQQYVATPASTTAATAGSGGSAGGASNAAASAPQRAGGVQTSPAVPPETPVTPAPKKQGASVTSYHVDLSFGEAGDQSTHKDVDRLTALPDGSNPVVVFLGVDKGGKTASFLVTSDASPQGDGKCEPAADDCQYVHLAVGEEEFLDVASGTAGLKQYILKVTRIRRTTSTAASAAAVAARRQSAEGADVVRSEVGPGHVVFAPAAGTVSLH